MKKIFFYAWLLATTGCMVSCIDDDNNYNYGQVNEIEGGSNNFNDINSKYNVAVGQEVTICPTFKFTIDKENPDVSYEWTLDGKKIEGANEQSHTFSFDKSGSHDVSFYVIDNKTGLKYGTSTIIKVMAAYQRGWVILSKGEDGRAILNFITPSSIKYTATYEGKEFSRDSIVYKTSTADLNKNLVKNPTGMFLSIGNADYYGDFGIEEFDEVIIKGDKWEELNGNTLEHETYTAEEFGDDLPEGFKPVEGTYTYSLKAVRSEDNYIYCNVKTDAADFHIGNFMSMPINNSMKFKRLFPNYKYGMNFNTILALSDDNSLMAIADGGTVPSFGSEATISEYSRYKSGNVYDVTCEDENMNFSKMKENIVELFPACDETDYQYSYPWYVGLTQDPDSKQYSLMNFKIYASYRSTSFVHAEDYIKRPFGLINDYRGMTVFQHKHYVIVADGNSLYYCQYGTLPNHDTELLGERKLIKTFDHNITAINGQDVRVNTYTEKYDYPGQLGVALENGEFFIFSLVEQKDEEGNCEAVNIIQNFPNEFVGNNQFGTIVDVLYKGGQAKNYITYQF